MHARNYGLDSLSFYTRLLLHFSPQKSQLVSRFLDIDIFRFGTPRTCTPSVYLQPVQFVVFVFIQAFPTVPACVDPVLRCVDFSCCLRHFHVRY